MKRKGDVLDVAAHVHHVRRVYRPLHFFHEGVVHIVHIVGTTPYMIVCTECVRREKKDVRHVLRVARSFPQHRVESVQRVHSGVFCSRYIT